MYYTEIDTKTAAKLVAKVSDIEAEGGMASFEHGDVTVLRHHCFAVIGGQPCTVFYDKLQDRYKVLTVSGATGSLQDIGYLTVEQLAMFDQKEGFFYSSSGPIKPQSDRKLLY